MEQLALAFAAAPALTERDFIVTPANAEAHGWIMRWPDWPANALLLQGPASSGKTHLAHLWTEKTHAVRVQGEEVSEGGVPELAEHALVVEYAERVAERTLFHLLNLMRERGNPLLLTSRLPVVEWGVALPDLISRLKALPIALLHAPDDALLKAVFFKHFRDRQVSVAEDVADYLMPRAERSLESVRKLAEALDAAALAQQRPITLPLARRVLADLNAI